MGLDDLPGIEADALAEPAGDNLDPFVIRAPTGAVHGRSSNVTSRFGRAAEEAQEVAAEDAAYLVVAVAA
jgi:hypothetical protein